MAVMVFIQCTHVEQQFVDVECKMRLKISKSTFTLLC